MTESCDSRLLVEGCVEAGDVQQPRDALRFLSALRKHSKINLRTSDIQRSLR